MKNDNPPFFKTQKHAAELIKAGMRIGLVHSITGVSWRPLKDLWNMTHGMDVSPPGRLPSNTMSYIKNGHSLLAISTVVSVYLSLEDKYAPLETFIRAWEAAKLFADTDTAVDINAAWFAIRDTKAGLVAFCECKECKAGYIFDAKVARKKNSCPFCGGDKSTLMRISQCS